MVRTGWRRWAAAMLALVSGAAAAERPEKVVAYVGATVLDVRSGEMRAGLTIVTRGERIAAVQPAAAPVPAGAERVAAAGLFAIPGLIDVHQHLAIGQGRRAAEAALRREVHSGVTAVRDMTGDARILVALAHSARIGEIPAADVYFAGLFAGPSFFTDGRMAASAESATAGKVPWLRAIRPEDDLRVAIAELRVSGASGIKVYGNLEPALVARIAAEARRQSVPVWAHAAVFPATPLEVAKTAPATMSHVCMLAYQALKPPPLSYHDRAPLDEPPLGRRRPHAEVAKALAAMRERGIVLDTTLWVYREIERMRREMTQYKPPTYCSSRLAEALAGQAYRAGVMLATGTDAPARAASAYPAVFDEMELLRGGAGLAPVDVIRAATVNAARALGQEGEMGAIEPGKLANIAFLAEDPLGPRAKLRSVVLTVKRGRAYWRRDYVPVTAEELNEF
jgi:imidazolonepropionase-like amidohydrolase